MKKLENVTGAALWQHTLRMTDEAFEARRWPHSRNRSSLSRTMLLTCHPSHSYFHHSLLIHTYSSSHTVFATTS